MTEGLASEIAEEKMRQIGLKRKHYMLRYRHLRFAEQGKQVLKGENQFFIVINVPKGVKVQSKAGLFDLQDSGLSELQHVHRGLTWVTCENTSTTDVILLQIIPKIKMK